MRKEKFSKSERPGGAINNSFDVIYGALALGITANPSKTISFRRMEGGWEERNVKENIITITHLPTFVTNDYGCALCHYV